MYSFLRERRWVIATIVVALIAVLFVNLGFWQIRRLHWRKGNNVVILAQEKLPPVSVDTLAGRPLDAIQYRRVTATGTYDAGREAILFGRPDAAGLQGNHLLTPFTTTEGNSLIVDRGWVPLSSARSPVEQAAPPAGTATVTGVLLPPESEAAAEPPSEGQVKDINIGQLQASTGQELMPAYLLLQGQDPAQTGDFPKTTELPALTEGPHLSYAIQWFLFTIIGLVGYSGLVRKEAKERVAAAQPKAGS